MEKDERKTKCVILADGQFPQSKRALTALRSAEYICCCDGAVEKLLAAGIEPSVIVGDGDSVSDELKEKYRDIFIKIDEQEYNDLTKATRYCIRKGYNNILYLGATGLREDHTIGNIFLLPYYLEELGINPIMLTDEGVFTVHRENATIKASVGQKISIFNINCKTLSSKGLKWETYPFTQLWQGTLNEASKETVCIDGDGVFIVFKQEKE